MTTHITRPRLHFTPRRGWINDPLGLTFHGGVYHLFFQFVPGQTEWGPNQRWGHATSPDLLHWTEGPVALAPGEGDDGVWSGSIVVPEHGSAALFYTTIELDDFQVGKARIARPTDDSWTTWVKGEIVAELPEDVKVVAYRDPYVFHDGTAWRMLMGAGLIDGTATALTYRSDDLETWAYDGLLATRHRDETEPLWMGAVWECPQLFQLGEKWVLTVSVWEPIVPYYEAYAIGTLVDGRFTAESWGRLSYGPSYYAGSTFVDENGSRGLIYWLRGVDDVAGAWASANSVPHVLRLDGTRIVAEPHPSIAAQRTGGEELSAPGRTTVSGVSDLEWTLDALDAEAQLELTSSDGATKISFAVADSELTARAGGESWTMPLNDPAIRIVVDGPVVEIFTSSGVMAFPAPGVTEVLDADLGGQATLRTFTLS